MEYIKLLYCPKCNCVKDNYQYANSRNSTKFCVDCGTALGVKHYQVAEWVGEWRNVCSFCGHKINGRRTKFCPACDSYMK